MIGERHCLRLCALSASLLGLFVGTALAATICDIGAYEFQDFAGETGQANCFDESVRTLTGQFGSLDAAASAPGYSSVRALQNAISAFVKDSLC